MRTEQVFHFHWRTVGICRVLVTCFRFIDYTRRGRACLAAAALNAPSKRCLQSRHAVKMQAHLHQIRILLKIQMTISE